MLTVVTLLSLLSNIAEWLDYTFEMGDFFNTMLYYATLIFNSLIPVGAIAVGLAFGVGMVLLIIKLVKGSVTSI